MWKRAFDLFFSIMLLLLAGWLILVCSIIAAIDTKSNGFFLQKRIGRFGLPFMIYKIRTINNATGHISAVGKFFRRSKLDEFPQLWNVLKGDMSFVGPRPDVPGYYDKLNNHERDILKLRPGITGPASLKYFDEDEILNQQPDPLHYNNEVIFPDKVKINLQYQKKMSLLLDMKILLYTIIRKKVINF